MNDGAYAGLRLATRASEPAPDNSTTTQLQPEANGSASGQQEETTMPDPITPDTDREDAIAQASASATAAANARYGAVLASEHYDGNKKLAATLLGNDKLSADEIIAALASVEHPAAAAAVTEEARLAAAEAGGRAAMQDVLAEGANSNIDASGGADGNKPDAKAEADTIWGRAYGLDQKGVN